MSINTRDFRHTMGLFATGVTVVASGEGNDLRAMTANAITSVSLRPMLILVCVHKEARLVERLKEGNGFSVNILHHEQQTLSNYFAGGWKKEPLPPFEFVPWQGGPRLRSCIAALGCELHELVEGGDHWIAIGEVVALHKGRGARKPLLFYQGRYRALAMEPEVEIPAIWDFRW